jgi:hypothetical protein
MRSECIKQLVLQSALSTQEVVVVKQDSLVQEQLLAARQELEPSVGIIAQQVGVAPSAGTLRLLVLYLRRFLRVRSEYPARLSPCFCPVYFANQ